MCLCNVFELLCLPCSSLIGRWTSSFLATNTPLEVTPGEYGGARRTEPESGTRWCGKRGPEMTMTTHLTPPSESDGSG